jgi:hypothetical protein
VRRQDHACCASITCMIRHYVARRAKVIEDHPHNAEKSASQNQPAVFGDLLLGIGSTHGSLWHDSHGRRCHCSSGLEVIRS